MIFSDIAIDTSREDRLDRAPAARALAETLADPAVGTPLTIGVLGGWGTGKTSLMKLFAAELRQTERGRNDLIVWFDAWPFSSPCSP